MPPSAWARAALGVLALLLAAALGSYALRRMFPPASWGVPETRLLFVGSSHLDGAIAYRRLPVPAGLMFVAGGDGALLGRALAVHRDRFPRLRCVVLELDEVTLLGDRVWQHRRDLSALAAELDLDAWQLPAHGGGLRRGLELGLGLARGRGWSALDPAKRLTLENLERVLAVGGGPWVPERALPPPAPRTSTLSLELSRRGVDFLLREAVDPEPNLRAYEAAAAALTGEGLRVILLTTPNHALYRALRPPQWDALIARAVSRARAAAGAPIPHWDLRADPRMQDEHFNNATHLVPRGAALFTDGLIPGLASEGCLAR